MRHLFVIFPKVDMRRSLDPDLEEYLRERVRRWLAEDPRRTAAQLAGAAGLSEGHVSNFQKGPTDKGGRRIGVEAATGLAAAFGLTWEEMAAEAKAWSAARATLPRPPPIPSSAVAGLTYQELDGWTAAAEVARSQERAPAYAIDAAGRGVVSWAVREVSVDLVVDEALRWLKHAPFDVRRDAETAAANAKSIAASARSGEVMWPSANEAGGTSETTQIRKTR